MNITQILTLHNLKVAGAALTSIITVAGAFCAMTPTPPVNTRWGKLYRLIELLALNFGKAKMVSPMVEQLPAVTTDSAMTVGATVTSTMEQPK